MSPAAAADLLQEVVMTFLAKLGVELEEKLRLIAHFKKC